MPPRSPSGWPGCRLPENGRRRHHGRFPYGSVPGHGRSDLRPGRSRCAGCFGKLSERRLQCTGVIYLNQKVRVSIFRLLSRVSSFLSFVQVYLASYRKRAEKSRKVQNRCRGRRGSLIQFFCQSLHEGEGQSAVLRTQGCIERQAPALVLCKPLLISAGLKKF